MPQPSSSAVLAGLGGLPLVQLSKLQQKAQALYQLHPFLVERQR